MSLRRLLDSVRPHLEKGGRFEWCAPLYEAIDTFLFSPDHVTSGSVHVRDRRDLKQVMITVVIALIPCILMGVANVGYEADRILQLTNGYPSGWRGAILSLLGFSHAPESIVDNMLMGTAMYLPILLVTFAVGGFWEALFAVVRKKEINEGFLVTGTLFSLILPPTIPLWQVALGISFGVVIGKEIFGGTGMNFLNPALAGRAFLYFAYPGQLSGDRNWVAVDGYSGATLLSKAADRGVELLGGMDEWWRAFLGIIPGSIGETSTLACIIGAVLLIATGVGSWRIMLAVLAGGCGTTLLFNLVGSGTNPMFDLPFYWHVVMGGFAFGTVFMATDPVSAAMTRAGQWVYGGLIGSVCILIRVVNPAFPEGMMLAILLGNVCAPLIDQVVIRLYRRGRVRHGEG